MFETSHAGTKMFGSNYALFPVASLPISGYKHSQSEVRRAVAKRAQKSDARQSGQGATMANMYVDMSQGQWFHERGYTSHPKSDVVLVGCSVEEEEV